MSIGDHPIYIFVVPSLLPIPDHFPEYEAFDVISVFFEKIPR